MTIPALRLLGPVLAILAGSSAARADTDAPADIIPPTDPRFEVFELSNAAGDRSYSSPVGTILLSFISKDQRYCRSARFQADQTAVLACREETGWKVEATSNLAQTQATSPANFGGGYMQEVGEAIAALMASVEPLDEREIIEAASKGWRNPAPIDEKTCDARDILRKTATVYRPSKSYIDSGSVHTRYRNSRREWTGETRFKTAYVAPFHFRFEST